MISQAVSCKQIFIFPRGDHGQKLLKSWDFEADLYTSCKLSIWKGMRVDREKDIVKTRCAKPLQFLERTVMAATA